MRNLFELLEKLKKDLYCPVCHLAYEDKEIKLKGFFNQMILVQTVCPNRHLTVFITGLNEKDIDSNISTDEILDLHQFLISFNGDFSSLWKKSI